LGKIADPLITKEGTNTESYYDYLISRYIAPFFTLFFKKIGTKNPNSITYYSFALMIIPSIMVIFHTLLDSIFFRIGIAFLIQVSFALDCSDGQLARIIGKTSKHGAWLDKILDRIGDFLIFTCYGFTAWQQYGALRFLFLGLITGYGLSIFTMALSLSDRVQYENLDTLEALQEKNIKRESPHNTNEHKEKKKQFFSIIKKIFFFLNFGIGERYLYLSFFVLINRIDVMLYITAFLTTLRFLGISHYVSRIIRKYDMLIRGQHE
jgi:phosphatidylglycerophosphate synthase